MELKQRTLQLITQLKLRDFTLVGFSMRGRGGALHRKIRL
jgi:hypothetical protein